MNVNVEKNSNIISIKIFAQNILTKTKKLNKKFMTVIDVSTNRKFLIDLINMQAYVSLVLRFVIKNAI